MSKRKAEPAPAAPRSELLRRAFEDAVWLGERLAGLAAFRDAVGEAASLEALAEAAQQRRDALAREAAGIEQHILELQAQGQAERTRLAELREQTQAEAAAMRQAAADELAAARSRAASIVEEAAARVPSAQAEADEIIAEAHRQSEAIVAQALAGVADVRARIAAGERECAAIEQRRSALKAAIAELHKQIDTLREDA